MEHTSKTRRSTRLPAEKNRLYPAFLVIEGKLCVVVGGGRVATRKVHALLAAGARVVVVSPSLHVDLQTLLAAGLIEHIPNNYATEYVADAKLVFAATNNAEINLQIARDASERGLWVNVADNPENSDFYVPATIFRQDLTLAISTSGESPAFARYVRELLERSLSASLGRALEIIAQVRPLILTEAKEKQAQLWKSLFALHLETIIEVQGDAAARQIVEKWLEQNIGQGDENGKQDGSL